MDRHAKSLIYALNALKQPEYKPYIDAIYLYGSCARGDCSYASDVDLFIKLKENAPQRITSEIRKAAAPGDASLPEVDLKFSSTDRFSSSEQFNINIMKEGRLLWKRQ